MGNARGIFVTLTIKLLHFISVWFALDSSFISTSFSPTDHSWEIYGHYLRPPARNSLLRRTGTRIERHIPFLKSLGNINLEDSRYFNLEILFECNSQDGIFEVETVCYNKYEK